MNPMPDPRLPAPDDAVPHDAAPPADPVPRVRGLRLGRVAGVEIRLDRSWFLIAALTVVMYGPVLWRVYPELGWLNLVVALGFAVGLAVSVLVHELAHAAAGRRAGWPVDRIVLTLMGGHTTFGTVRARPLATAVVSLAGPLSNVVLAVVGELLLRGAPDGSAGPWWALAELLVLANWVLGVFNLLPGLPLDGGRVVEALVWAVTRSESRGTAVAAWCGCGIAALLALWVLWTQQWRQPSVLVVSLLVIGFIVVGAGQALRQARLMGTLDAVRADRIARPALEFSPVTPLSVVDATVAAATGDDYRGWVPDVVARDDARGTVGVLDPSLAVRVPDAHRARTGLGDVCRWYPREAVVTGGVAGGELARRMEGARRQWLWVVDDAGHVTGVVHHEDLARHALRG